MTLTKEKIMDNRGSVLCFYGISNNELIFLHSTGYLNCINVFTNSVILLRLPDVIENIFINIYSIIGQAQASNTG